MTERLRGTVTFLFTDIEGSTALLREAGEAYDELLATHRQLLRAAFTSRNGIEVDTQGDAFLVAFANASDAVHAAVDAQLALVGHAWPDGREVRVRMGLHTGEARLGDEGYTGLAVHHGARVGSAAHGRQIIVSPATRAVCAGELDDGIDLVDLGEFMLKDLTAPEHLYQVHHPDLPSEFPKPKTLDARPHNLPVQPTPLVGRATELAAARDLLLRDDVRLVTLSGPGGIGKTRLSVQVGAEIADEFAHGVWLVPLASLTDPALVTAAIAEVLGVVESPGVSTLDAVKAYLADRRTLLVLDNFEQVTDAATDVAELLSAGAGLKILVTSRHVLRIRGEHELPVEPLDTDESVALFVDRAQAARRTFELSDDNASDVAEICRRLDGLPLAIELAAARVKLFQPKAMLARLSKSLELLTGGARDLPERHKTLRGAIAWSYDLLEPAEQAALQRLSVFAGGCGIEAAEAVCGDDLDGDLFDAIESLVDKSLLRQQDDDEGEPRFVMLSTIRDFGLEVLRDSGDEAEVRERHFEWFSQLALSARDELAGPDRAQWLNRLAADHDNMRAALESALAGDEPTRALPVAIALAPYWIVRGHLAEGRTWVERARLAADGAEPRRTADALRAEGSFASRQGDHDAVERLVGEALTLDRECERPTAVAQCLNILAVTAQNSGRGDARALYGESLSILREAGDRPRLAETLNNLGSLEHDHGSFEQARALYQESASIFREIGNTPALAPVLGNLGIITADLGDHAAAADFYEQSLEAHEQVGDQRGIANALGNIGNLALRRGDFERAEEMFAKSLRIQNEMDDQPGVALSMLDHADLARRRGQLDNAVELATRAIEQAGQLGEEWMVQIGWMILARTHSDRGDQAAATELATRLRTLAETSEDRVVGTQAIVILAVAAWRAGDASAAQSLAPEALSASEQFGDQELIAEALEMLGAVASGAEDGARSLSRALEMSSGLGDTLRSISVVERIAYRDALDGAHDRAARLLSAAEAARSHAGAARPVPESAHYRSAVDACRSGLGEPLFEDGWTAGGTMPLDEAIQLALARR